MRTLASGVALLASLLLLVACGDNTPTAPSVRPDGSAQSFRGVAHSDTLGFGVAQTADMPPSTLSDSTREEETERGGFIGSGH